MIHQGLGNGKVPPKYIRISTLASSSSSFSTCHAHVFHKQRTGKRLSTFTSSRELAHPPFSLPFLKKNRKMDYYRPLSLRSWLPSGPVDGDSNFLRALINFQLERTVFPVEFRKSYQVSGNNNNPLTFSFFQKSGFR